uniref:Uncharacterized protein n=1 Tax=Glossina morsitans morsitans TaxID=37546 RepID=A0A1B0G5V3_GLOMM
MLAFLSDPYHSDVIKRGSGTAENPILIPSAFNGRTVGCICNDNRFVNYMWLEKGCPNLALLWRWWLEQQLLLLLVWIFDNSPSSVLFDANISDAIIYDSRNCLRFRIESNGMAWTILCPDEAHKHLISKHIFTKKDKT